MVDDNGNENGVQNGRQCLQIAHDLATKLPNRMDIKFDGCQVREISVQLMPQENRCRGHDNSKNATSRFPRTKLRRIARNQQRNLLQKMRIKEEKVFSFVYKF
ncbi:hypothetical protein DMN91_007691 [Ooceraea biroi]|uniref:Uncharacterized protein n=1 Tax=Ooceraea biroi TaxID=2015173 RepID=A0A3L8DKV1_OOCBI|nr:hypothetical protein DMN91_007691 [Ooceraea biroi]